MARKSNKEVETQTPETQAMEAPEAVAAETEKKAPKGYYTDKDGNTSVYLNRVSSKLVFDVTNDPIMKRVSIPLKESPTGRATISVAFADGVDSTNQEQKSQVKHSRAVVKNEDGSFSQGRASTDLYDINLGAPDKVIPVGVPKLVLDENEKPVLNEKGKPKYTTEYVDKTVEEIRAEFYENKEAYAAKNAGKEIPEDDHGKSRIIRNVHIKMIKDNEAYNEKAATAAAERGQEAPEPRKQISFTDLPPMKDVDGKDIEMPTGSASINVPASSIQPSRDRDRFGRHIDNSNYNDVYLGKEREILKLNVCVKAPERTGNGTAIKGTSQYETRYVTCDEFQKAFNASKQVHKEHGPYSKDDIAKVTQNAAEMDATENSAEAEGPEVG